MKQEHHQVIQTIFLAFLVATILKILEITSLILGFLDPFMTDFFLIFAMILICFTILGYFPGIINLEDGGLIPYFKKIAFWGWVIFVLLFINFFVRISCYYGFWEGVPECAKNINRTIIR